MRLLPLLTNVMVSTSLKKPSPNPIIEDNILVIFSRRLTRFTLAALVIVQSISLGRMEK